MEHLKKYISEEEVRLHNKKDDLWIVKDGKVYDVTKWVVYHPGGELPLLYFSGQDVTNVFLAYHPISTHKHLEKFFTGYYIRDYKISEISADYQKMWKEFQNIRLFDNKGHGTMILMIIALIMFFLSVYGVLATSSPWGQIGCAGLLGFTWIQFGWITHDSAHYQTMTTPWWNRLLLLIVSNCFIGIAGCWWKKGHNAHHIATNSLEFDPTTQFLPFFAQSNKSFTSLTSYFYEKKISFNKLTRHMVSYQNFTFFLTIVLARIIQFFESFNLLFSKTDRVSNRGLEFIGILGFWTWFSLLVSCCSNWLVMVGFVAIAFVVAGFQNFQIAVNHLCCDTYVGQPKGAEWFEKQTSGSLNIECPPWMDWFHGGLQFQIEHHLFPRMPRCQLRKISPLVKDLCKKHNLPYNCAKSFWEATMLSLDHVNVVAFEAPFRINAGLYSTRIMNEEDRTAEVENKN